PAQPGRRWGGRVRSESRSRRSVQDHEPRRNLRTRRGPVHAACEQGPLLPRWALRHASGRSESLRHADAPRTHIGRKARRHPISAITPGALAGGGERHVSLEDSTTTTHPRLARASLADRCERRLLRRDGEHGLGTGLGTRPNTRLWRWTVDYLH